MPKPIVGVIGLGVVGGALCHQLLKQGYAVHVYDRDALVAESVPRTHPGATPCLSLRGMVAAACAMLFVALPTQPDGSADGYDTGDLYAVCETLAAEGFLHPAFVFSTVTPGTVDALKAACPQLNVFHVPEFLSSGCAALDTEHPTRPNVLLGVPAGTPSAVSERARCLLQAYAGLRQRVTAVRAKESEATKLFCNAFYAVKVQFCNELHSICKLHDISYDMVRHLMLENGWIHPMHTHVPGPDGNFSFAGKCLPKDLEALVGWGATQQHGCPILQATLASRTASSEPPSEPPSEP
jgi:UDPglucose 6-dehydrogenase